MPRLMHDDPNISTGVEGLLMFRPLVFSLLLSLVAGLALASIGPPRSGTRDAQESSQQGSTMSPGSDISSVSVTTTESGDPPIVTHTFKLCIFGTPTGSYLVELGGAEMKITADGLNWRVSSMPVGSQTWQPYLPVNWSSSGPPYCVTFSYTEQQLGNPSGAPDPTKAPPHDVEFKASSYAGAEPTGQATDKAPDSGSGTHGW